MNRTFQGKITPGMMMVFLVILGLTFYYGWNKHILVLATLPLAIIWLERMLHTAFMVTSSGKIIIRKGRFSKEQVIDIMQIARIEKGDSIYAKLGVFSYMNLVMKDGRIKSVWPSDEQGFLDYVKKKHDTLNTNQE